MKKLIYFTLLFPLVVNAVEPKTEIKLQQQQAKIQHLEKQLNQQKKDLQKQARQLNELNKKQQQLAQQAGQNQQKFANLSQETQEQYVLFSSQLSGLSEQTEERYSRQQQGYQNLTDKLQETESVFSALFKQYRGFLFGGLGILISLFLVGYIFLSRRIKRQQYTTESLIAQTRHSLEEESVKLDEKLLSLLDNSLKVQEYQSVTNEIDHSLALKVADEIIRIQKNLGQMDASVKGLKQLNASVKRIQDNFAAQGYELVEMLGQEYHEGMKVNANFVPSEQIESGKQIITRIIKPQVNFKGEMIQAAQIEVGVGE